MAIKQFWIQEPHIIKFNLSGEITLDDFNTIGQTGLAFATQNKLYVLFDFSEVEALPKNLVSAILRATTLIEFINHDNLQHIVIVQPNQATRLMIETVFRDVPITIIEDVASGIDLLKQQFEAKD